MCTVANGMCVCTCDVCVCTYMFTHYSVNALPLYFKLYVDVQYHNYSFINIQMQVVHSVNISLTIILVAGWSFFLSVDSFQIHNLNIGDTAWYIYHTDIHKLNYGNRVLFHSDTYVYHVK